MLPTDASSNWNIELKLADPAFPISFNGDFLDSLYSMRNIYSFFKHYKYFTV